MSPLTKAQNDVVASLDTNFCVTSGAGCGKTRVLVERYVRFLEADRDLPLERLAAITFTENAAAEMRDRIRRACREHVDAARLARDPVRVKTWLQRYWDVDIAPINTIHGFASSLLRRYPIEAGVDPNFALLDEAQAALLRKDVVAAAVERLLARGDAHLVTVIEQLGLTEAREVLAEVVAEERETLQRVAGPVMARGDDEILTGLKKAFDEKTTGRLRGAAGGPEFIEAVATLERLSGDTQDKREQVRREAVDQVQRLRDARTADIARAAAERLSAINLRGGSAANWPSKEDLQAAGAALGVVRQAVREALEGLPPFDEALERRHLALARAFYATAGRLIEAYEAAKREQSALDFEDLQIRARDLLRHAPRVLEECRRRFRAILVDELQDTNFLQFEIVDLLVSGDAGRHKEPPLRPGALFGVGDPKQSIYRFRGAQVEVFERALRRAGPAGRRNLGESFRLHPGTADLVNHLFGALMGDRYEPIEGKRPQRNEAVGELHIVVEPEGERLDVATACTAEAQRLAARLREIVETKAVTVADAAAPDGRPARYGDVAILLRRTTHLHLYEEALEREGVPYYVVSGSGFYKQQEVLDVIHLLRVLDDPRDDLHLAGVLRSPLFAVSDEALYQLRRLGPSLHEALPSATSADGLDPEDRRGLARAAAALPQWIASKDRLGLGALVDRVVFDSGYAAASVGRFGGARAYANLRQMVELARRFERDGLTALGDYVDYVTDFMQGEMREEQAPVEAPGGDTVRIMTIHKAKGLEFPVVALPDLAHAPQGSRSPVFIHPAAGLAVRLRDEDGQGQTSAAMALARLDDADAERDESNRLLYVAITRTKEYLILVGSDRYNAPRESWLEALCRQLGVDREPGSRTVRLPAGGMMQVIALVPQPAKARSGSRRAGPRDVFAAGRVCWDRLRDRAQAARAPDAGRALEQVAGACGRPRPPAQITATALAAYRRCPRFYAWTEVLGVSEPEPTAPGTGFPARLWGIACHRAMEICTSADDKAVRAAVQAALREMAAGRREGLEEAARRLAASVSAFWQSPLGRRVAAARQVYREMPFVLRFDQTEVRGTVDLVFESADGRWEIVDYKSSAPGADDAQERSAEYALQLGLYALAAGRWLGRPVARWSVHFLGSGVTVERELTPADLEHTAREINAIIASVRNPGYNYNVDSGCGRCRYQMLCDQGPHAGAS